MDGFNDIHDKLEYMNTSLKEIDHTLEKYLENYNILQISRVLGNNCKLNNENTDDKELMLKEKDIAEVVEICNQLWVINGLINEYMNETLEISNKVNSFKKLRMKLSDLKRNFSGVLNFPSITITVQLEEKLDLIKSDLWKSLNEIFNKYLKINDDLSIEFSQSIDNLRFDEFLKLYRTFPTNEINHVFDLNKIFSTWINQVFLKLDAGSSVFVTSEDLQTKVNIDDSNNFEFSEFLRSIEQLILFFNEFTKSVTSIKEYSNLRIILGKLILKNLKIKIFEKKNVYPLIIEKLNYDEYKNDGTESKLCNITKLYKISSSLSKNGWSKDGICELEFWIDDLTNSWIDNLINIAIEDLKEFSIKLLNKEFDDDLQLQNLISIELDLAPVSSTPGERHENEDAKLNAADDGWNNWETNNEEEDWDNNVEINEVEKDKKEKKESSLEPEIDQDDDGWGVDEDIDLDSEDDENEEEEWGAWDEEVKIDDVEDVRKSTSNPLQSSEVKPSYKYSKLTSHIMKIFEKYMQNYQDIKDLNINKLGINETKELFKHGFKKLCVSYFMIIQYDVKGIYGNEVLFYNDFNKILEECCLTYGVRLDSCYTLNLNMLNSEMNIYYEKINKVLEDYDSKIWNDSNDFQSNNDRLKEFSAEFLIRFKSRFDEVKFELFESNSLNTQLILNNFLTIIFKLFNSICDKILSRKDISSYESTILTNIIDEITNHVILSNLTLVSKIEKIQTFEKLTQIKLILSSNLKEILNEFYDAKLFELETHEIVLLIESLFIESEQRSKVITEIQNVREATF